MSLTTRMGNALAPSNYSEARQFAELIANSDMVPKDFRGKPGNVMVAMQWGAEIGLGPLQAIQNIAVINNRPSVWGDAAIALARSHPLCEYITEGVEGEGDARYGWCETKRKGAPKPERRTFSVADAKRAGLWGKQGPWQQYPDRMLPLRARGFLIRDVYPDALRGLITTEEAQDLPTETLPPAAGPTITSTAERVTQPAAPEGFTMLAPDGAERLAPDLARWVAWCKAALGKLESGQAVHAWREAMAEHMDRVALVDDTASAAVAEAIEAAMDKHAEAAQ